MRQIQPQQLFSLVLPGSSTCISIYVNNREDLEHRIEEAKRLASTDMSLKSVEALLQPLTDFMTSRKFRRWRFPAAFYIMRGFAGMTSLPFRTKNMSVVTLNSTSR
jgi:hypothetical protein